MKYKITNLDKFISEQDKINSMVFEPSKQLINKIMDNRDNVIENKIKELISPYIDVTATEHELMELIEKSNYKFDNTFHRDYEEYSIIDKTTDKKDYFIAKYNVDLENYQSWVNISDIIRGIW